MKRKVLYVLLILTFFLTFDNVSAVTKPRSDADGVTSAFTSNYSESYTYISGVVKISDHANDSIAQFSDSDNDDDYILAYHIPGASNVSTFYYTKLDQKVTDSKGNTIYYGDPNDSEYSNFLDEVTSSWVDPGGKFSNLTPIVVVSPNGTESTYYIDGGSDKSKLATTLKNWENSTNYTNEYKNDWGFLTHDLEDNTGYVQDPNSENNELDDSLKKRQESDIHEQEVASGKISQEATHSSTWAANDGSTNKFLKKMWNMIKIIVPMLVIIFSIVDFLKVLFVSEEKNYKEAYHKMLWRIAIGIILFVLPAILALLLDLAGLKDIGIFEIFS